MPYEIRFQPGDPKNRLVKYKLIDTDPATGESVWAEIVALEPDSIGGGGGGLTDAQLRATPVPVSGTFWQAVQPVSGPLTDAQLRAASVPISDGGGSLTVDGTFWQATQPVSGPLTDAQLRAVAVPVSGTFWQATQPVSGTITANQGGSWVLAANSGVDIGDVTINNAGGAAAVNIQDGGNSITVDGTFWQATQPVSLATNTPDVTDRATREVGRIRVWDGTDEATILPNRTQPATTEKSLATVDMPFRMPTYHTTTIAIAPAITVGVKELLAIWHAAAGTKDIYITEISVAGLVTTAGTAGRSAIRVSTITTAPTGGTEEAKVDLTGAGASDMTNTMRVKTGGGTIGSTFIRKGVWSTSQAVNSRVSEALFKVDDLRNAIILRQGSASGISIDIEREVAHTALVDQWYVTVRWLEL